MLVPVDDSKVELNEYTYLDIYVVFEDPWFTTDDYVLAPSTDGNHAAKILDDEWRWEEQSGDTSEDYFMVTNGYYPESVDVYNHPITGMVSILSGNVKSAIDRIAPQSELDGQNTISILADGQFRDNVGWFGSSYVDYEAEVRQDFTFDLDPVSGHITVRAGSPGLTKDYDGDLEVAVSHNTPIIDQTTHTVSMYVAGGVGVSGSWSIGGSVGQWVGLQWAANEDWSEELGPWEDAVVLRAVRGADN